jgi:hypothetical protein
MKASFAAKVLIEKLCFYVAAKIVISTPLCVENSVANALLIIKNAALQQLNHF